MSRVIEAAALFAVGCLAGGAIVYGTRRDVPPPPPAQQPTKAAPPALRRDVLIAEPVKQGAYNTFSMRQYLLMDRTPETAQVWESGTGS